MFSPYPKPTGNLLRRLLNMLTRRRSRLELQRSLVGRAEIDNRISTPITSYYYD